MSAPGHDRWADRLSELVDGELAGDDLRAVRDHLAGCASCRDVAAELRRISEEARDLGEVPPPRDLWPGIEARLGGVAVEGVAPAPPVLHPQVGARGRGLFLSLPQLAAAAVLLVAVSSLLTAAAIRGAGGGVGAGAGSSSDLPVAAAGAATGAAADAPPGLAEEVEALTRAVRDGGERLDPETRRILEDNLAVVEAAISDARRALVQDPANPFLEEHLQRTWERKLAYLREAAGIVQWAAS